MIPIMTIMDAEMSYRRERLTPDHREPEAWRLAAHASRDRSWHRGRQRRP